MVSFLSGSFDCRASSQAKSIVEAKIKKGDHVQAMLITWAGTATTKDGREFLTNRTTIVRMQKDYYDANVSAPVF